MKQIVIITMLTLLLCSCNPGANNTLQLGNKRLAIEAYFNAYSNYGKYYYLYNHLDLEIRNEIRVGNLKQHFDADALKEILDDVVFPRGIIPQIPDSRLKSIRDSEIVKCINTNNYTIQIEVKTTRNELDFQKELLINLADKERGKAYVADRMRQIKETLDTYDKQWLFDDQIYKGSILTFNTLERYTFHYNDKDQIIKVDTEILSASFNDIDLNQTYEYLLGLRSKNEL